MEEENKNLFPQVKWAQRKHLIIIRVLIKPVEKPDFIIRRDYMTFKSSAIGLSGKAKYNFELLFYNPIQSDKCRVKFLENEIEFRLLKEQECVWPRLQSSHEKPHWISIDFTHWEYQKESEDEEDEEKEDDSGSIDPAKKAQVERTSEYLAEMESMMKKDMEKYNVLFKRLKQGYLILYNMIQWSGFVLIVMALVKSLSGGRAGISTAYEKAISMMMFSHILMLLEIVHSLLGFVKSSILPTFLQVFGRFLIIFAVLMPAVEIHELPIVFLLFLTWSLIEVIRYPFYALSLLNFEVSYLTWLRYSAWIVLYPIGFTCEALTIWLSLAHFDVQDGLEYRLPNYLNISFSTPYVLRAALAIVPLIAFNQISYMISQRKNKLAKVKTA